MTDPSLQPVYVRAGSREFLPEPQFQLRALLAIRVGPPRPGIPRCRLPATAAWAPRLINTNYNNFAPRLGIAWSPSDKWAVRTGFGLFYSQESKNSIFDLNRGLGGRTGQVTQTTYGSPSITYQNFINTSALPVTIPLGLTWGADHILPTTYSMQYLLNVQRTLGTLDDSRGRLQRLAKPSSGRPHQRECAHPWNRLHPKPPALSGIRSRRNTVSAGRRRRKLQWRRRQVEPAFPVPSDDSAQLYLFAIPR